MTGLGCKRGHVRRRVPCLSTLRRAPRPWTPPGGDRVGVRIVLKFIFQLQVTRYYISFSPLFLLWLCGPLWRAKSERRHRAGTFHLRYAHLPHDFVMTLSLRFKRAAGGPAQGWGLGRCAVTPCLPSRSSATPQALLGFRLWFQNLCIPGPRSAVLGFLHRASLRQEAPPLESVPTLTRFHFNDPCPRRSLPPDCKFPGDR